MQAKESLVRAHTFPPPLTVYKIEYQPSKGSAHFSITKNMAENDIFLSISQESTYSKYV